jgi:hypothetical protein
MDSRSDFELALKELKTGIDLTKCQQCGCMSETLNQIGEVIPVLLEDRTPEFRDALPGWLEKMKSIRYSCLGCEHCYAGVAQNAFTAAFPETENQFGLILQRNVRQLGSENTGKSRFCKLRWASICPFGKAKIGNLAL